MYLGGVSLGFINVTPHSKFEFGDRSTARTHIGLLLNPLSEASQKWSTVLEVRISHRDWTNIYPSVASFQLVPGSFRRAIFEPGTT